MLTDDDLIRELEAGFRDETYGLRYAGPAPNPRRSAVPWSVLPVAAAVAAIVVVPRIGGPGLSTPVPPQPEPSVQVSPASPKVVTHRVDLAAFQSAVARAGDSWPPLTWRIGVRELKVPADAEPVEGVASPAKAWVSTDPDSGLATLWIDAPTRAGGMTFSASGAGWSQDQLIHLLLTGER
jgi:hypothetical protein